MTTEYKGLLEQALKCSASYMEQLPLKAVFPTSDDLQGLSVFDEPLPDDGTDASDVLACLVEHLCDSAAYFASELTKAGISVVNPPCFNQFMVRGKDDEDTLRMLQFIQNSGVCWCGGSQWEVRPVIRVSVCSHATTREDIDRSVQVFITAKKG